MRKYPKTLYKKGGKHSINIEGKRFSYSVVTAKDEEHEESLLDEGWSNDIRGESEAKEKPKTEAKAKPKADK